MMTFAQDRAVMSRIHVLALACALAGASGARSDDFATSVISYVPGTNPANGFNNPSAALGAPERFTGEGISPGAVTPFVPAFGTAEIVSIGAGGSLTLAFTPPIVDHANNPFGVDLIVFGNSFFTDGDWPTGVCAGLAADGGIVQLSSDGVAWVTVPNVVADGLFPTMAFTDAGPYSSTAGRFPSDPHLPCDPSLVMSDLQGMDYDQLVDAYAGSAGGIGVDLASVGLSSAVAVRIVVPGGFHPNVEIDAVSRVLPRVRSADIDANGVVGGSDLSMLLSAFGSGDASTDLDRDGIVGGSDLTQLLASWGPT
ncbi:MAG: hypothetical protein EBR10_04625 [Planctomycetes bacterium]|nr:hypothetical protein [Planctomycetota bacterium]